MLTPRVLREYALVADGDRGALIGPDGSVAWLCALRWDSPAAFSGPLGGVGRHRGSKGAELPVLRDENAVLRRQIGEAR